jgi:ferredoxin
MVTRYRIVSEICQSCGDCVGGCPIEAISADPYFINPVLCNACGDCVEACPLSAIEAYDYYDLPLPAPLIPTSLSLKMYEDR